MLSAHDKSLLADVKWLETHIDKCITCYFDETKDHKLADFPPPTIKKGHANTLGAYADFIVSQRLTTANRLMLILSLCVHIKPNIFDSFTLINKHTSRRFTEFGGVLDTTKNIFYPTLETVLFLLSPTDITSRLADIRLFDADSQLIKLGVISLYYEDGLTESFSSARLIINPNWINKFLLGHDKQPNYSRTFPAQLLQSKLNWEDLVLNSNTKEELNHLLTWVIESKTIMHEWDFQRHIKPGYKALFYGPPGTGKTLSASLLGKKANLDVYRVDLSSLVSKYIGETEKNLAAVFNQAEQKSWILFFDEADALFSQRSAGSSANDRHSNQEIAYLLQRMELFDGIVILASNLKGNIDEAFNRRFQSVIFFPIPDASERLALWKNILDSAQVDTGTLDLSLLANQYELSGGAMINAARFAAIKAIQKDNPSITQSDLELGITRELRKEGKFVS